MFRERIPNAYLFVGADSRILLDEAVFFARALNCSGKTESGPAPKNFSTGSARQSPPEADEGGCGQCESCKKIARRIHPDLLIISNPGKSIKIDEIREITDFVKYGPSFAGWKIVVVEGADLMTEEASNSFLKTLEEPHRNVLFILTTTRELFILKTVSSRCQKVMIPGMKVEKNETVDRLTEKFLNMGKMNIPSLLALSDELSVLPDLEKMLNLVLYNYREKVNFSSENELSAMRAILEAVRSLERRGNKRLALDHMFMSLKGAAGN